MPVIAAAQNTLLGVGSYGPPIQLAVACLSRLTRPNRTANGDSAPNFIMLRFVFLFFLFFFLFTYEGYLAGNDSRKRMRRWTRIFGSPGGKTTISASTRRHAERALVAQFVAIGTPAGGRIFVPLCGAEP